MGTIGTLVDDVADSLGKAEARDLGVGVARPPTLVAYCSTHRRACLVRCRWCARREAAHKRMAGAPLAYAVGRAAFRNLTLHVDERVLIPRPETEVLVDLVLAECRRPVP